jgi:hypothetical protein
MPSFGRRFAPDPRDRNYPVRTLLAEEPVPLRTQIWPCEITLNQDPRGACVLFSAGYECAATPEAWQDITNELCFAWYDETQWLDEFDDTPPEEGTSVRAGAETLVRHGRIVQYRWAFTVQEVLDAVIALGTGIAGTVWKAGMMYVDNKGFIHPTGTDVGGHAWTIIGYIAELDAFLFKQSWGEHWGIDVDGGRVWFDDDRWSTMDNVVLGTLRRLGLTGNGYGLISVTDMQYLLAQDGEFMVPVLRTHVGDTPPPPEPPVDDEDEEPEGCFIPLVQLRRAWRVVAQPFRQRPRPAVTYRP